MKKLRLSLLIFFVALLSGCGVLQNMGPVNLFTVEDDKQFGVTTAKQIENSKEEYPVLDRVKYAQAYARMETIMRSIAQSGAIPNATQFEWKLNLIDKPILNAFAVPGGHLYFYTGLIKYLDDESQMAGVMAHEMAHVGLRHSTAQMTKQYGVTALLSWVMGYNPSQTAQLAGQIVAALTTTAFSRSDEYQADAYAVRSLAGTEYDPRGVAGFFIKLEAEGAASAGVPTFLSTHPSPADRVEKIYATWEAAGSKSGSGDGKFIPRYQELKKMLP